MESNRVEPGRPPLGSSPSDTLPHPGNVEQSGHRARGEDQPIPAHRLRPTAGIAHLQPVSHQIDGVHQPRDQVHPGQGLRQRHRDRPRIENPAGHIGQQRGVQQVVLREDQRHLHPGGLVAQQPAHPPGALKFREPPPRRSPPAAAFPVRSPTHHPPAASTVHPCSAASAFPPPRAARPGPTASACR